MLEKHRINPAIPILPQISRFDRLKDPLGVIAAYRILKKRHKCQLVLAAGGAVGGIKLQIINGVTGYLVHSSEGAANRIAQLLGDRRLRERMGENGYQHVKENFLVTRHVKDYLLTILALNHLDESVVSLA